MPRENTTVSRRPCAALVGLDIPFHGDDAVGLVVARCVHQSLRPPEAVDLLEPVSSGFALVDPWAEAGAVRCLDMTECHGRAGLTPHTGGFYEGLAMGRAVGLEGPTAIALYGIVTREPQCFAEGLSRNSNPGFQPSWRRFAVAGFAVARPAALREGAPRPGRPEGGTE